MLDPIVLLRLALGWTAVGALLWWGPGLDEALPTPLLWLALALIVAVIVVCAFGVVTEAERLAHRLPDPYGTLVLTLSIAAIEVILIAAVMLGPGEHATIARDSVMAVSMIILNLVIGVALILHGRQSARRPFNRRGVTWYLAMLVLLLGAAFLLPGLIGEDGSYTPVQAIAVAIATVVAYTLFLVRQLGRGRADFQEVREPENDSAGTVPAGAPLRAVMREHGGELLARLLLLLAMAVPIVLLSHDMAALLDDGLARAGAPVALSGILIALIVFLPETITTVRAALRGEMQRVSNLCHGALVSTVGLTIPAVLTVGVLTGQPVALSPAPLALMLLAVTLALTVFTVARGRASVPGGVLHLTLFAAYLIGVFI